MRRCDSCIAGCETQIAPMSQEYHILRDKADLARARGNELGAGQFERRADEIYDHAYQIILACLSQCRRQDRGCFPFGGGLGDIPATIMKRNF